MAKSNDISQTNEKISKHSTKILQMLLNHFKQLVTHYFDQAYKADLQDYALEANYVVHELALDANDPRQKHLSLEKLTAIDQQTTLLAQQIKFEPTTMTIEGLNPTTRNKILAIAQEIFFYCQKKDDFSRTKIEAWLKQHFDTLVMAARDFLYTHLRQAFVNANAEIKRMLAHNQTKAVTKHRPKAISFIAHNVKKKIKPTQSSKATSRPKKKI